MNIVHFSDLHGGYEPLPPADLYIGTGDLLPNFPWLRFDVYAKRAVAPMEIEEYPTNVGILGMDPGPRPRGTFVGRRVDPLREVQLQTLFIERELELGGFRRHLGSPDAPVVLVRGNHDFVDLTPWFAGGPTFEVGRDGVSSEVLGLRFAGTRGINYIFGEWSDEYTDTQWREELRHVPRDCDVLVTHAPPRGILDREAVESYGSDQLSSYVHRRMLQVDESGARPLRAHFFGHIHGARGSVNIESTLFSNAATGWLQYEL